MEEVYCYIQNFTFSLPSINKLLFNTKYYSLHLYHGDNNEMLSRFVLDQHAYM
jgi:hypothetical protein